MAENNKTYLTEEVVITPNGNYTIPSLDAFMEQKAIEARKFAAKHIQEQKAPNVPRIPKHPTLDIFDPQAYASWIAGNILNMSDDERL